MSNYNKSRLEALRAKYEHALDRFAEMFNDLIEAERKLEDLNLMSANNQKPAEGATLPMVADSWRYGFNGMHFGFMDNGQFIAYECYEQLMKQNAALLSAAKLTVRRMGETGDAISINALNKAIEGCEV